MAFNDGYRQMIAQLVKDDDFLSLVRAGKSDDARQSIVEERFHAHDIKAKIEKVQTLPAGFGGGFRVTFILWDQGHLESLDFDQD